MAQTMLLEKMSKNAAMASEWTLCLNNVAMVEKLAKSTNMARLAQSVAVTINMDHAAMVAKRAL